MPFSILLLTAASSERHISGYGGDRVHMADKLLPGELVLFFDKVDSDVVSKGLGLLGKKCCDGIIFYSHGSNKVICLVEMKSSNLVEAEEQIKSTYNRLQELLKAECRLCSDAIEQITWKAYIYRSSGGPKKDAMECVERLVQYGFKKGNAVILGQASITEFLRRTENTNVRKYKKSKGYNRS
jgi:hypothetical protein